MPKHAKNKQSGGSRYQKHRQKCHETPFATADVANQLRNSVGIPAWQYGEANRIESVLRKQVDCEMDPPDGAHQGTPRGLKRDRGHGTCHAQT